MLLPACATKPPQVIRVPFEKTVIEKQFPPAELFRPCRAPELDPLETTQDLERVAGEAVAGLAACDEDKTRLREWKEANES